MKILGFSVWFHVEKIIPFHCDSNTTVSTLSYTKYTGCPLTPLHSERPQLHAILAFLSAIGLNILNGKLLFGGSTIARLLADCCQTILCHSTGNSWLMSKFFFYLMRWVMNPFNVSDPCWWSMSPGHQTQLYPTISIAPSTSEVLVSWLSVWPRSYKTFFMLNWVEYEILNVHKYKNIQKFCFY